MRKNFVFIILALVLTACAPVVKFARTPVVTSSPTQTPAPPTDMPTPEFTPITPTLLPTQPPVAILTPDAIQVERWREYQAELAKVFLAGYSPDLGYDPDLYKYALCEWDILGRSGQEVYVWVLCAVQGGLNGRGPAVIYLESDGAIQSVKKAGYEGLFYDLGLFPEDVQEKLDIYISPPFSGGRLIELGSHLDYREEHPDEPPLIALSDTLAITPAP